MSRKPTTKYNADTGNVPPEVHYKMAKKIAQLTKVIYYLNTKHEDHQDEMEAVTGSYESHVGQVCPFVVFNIFYRL